MLTRIRKKYRTFKGKPYIFYLKDYLSGCGSLLDVGCGRDSSIKHVVERGYSVGLDIFKPYILKSKRAKLHDDYVLASASNLCFKPKSFQTVALLDVLEHLSKSDGYKIMNQMEGLATDKVVVFTPNGFLKQQEDDGNIHQKHVSGWTVRELENIGFSVHGINGLKFFRKQKAEYRINQSWYFTFENYSQALAYRYPMVAFQLLAVKRVTDAHMSGLKNTIEKIKNLEAEKKNLLLEIEELKKMADAKATALESKVNALRDEVKSLKILMNGSEPGAQGN